MKPLALATSLSALGYLLLNFTVKNKPVGISPLFVMLIFIGSFIGVLFLKLFDNKIKSAEISAVVTLKFVEIYMLPQSFFKVT